MTEIEQIIGQNYYLKGTKQRFKIIDRNLGGDWFLISFTDLRKINNYQDYLHRRVTEEELQEKYQLIEDINV